MRRKDGQNSNQAKNERVENALAGCRVREVRAVEMARPTNIPGYDYVINPYVGCPHRCAYCYASYMDNFDPHPDAWGSYVDVRLSDEPLPEDKLTGKRVFLSSVTDPYNPLEAEYRRTRSLLEELARIECSVEITTKINLVLRDIDVLKEMHDVVVNFSLNTLDENFRYAMDNASSVAARLNALKTLHEEGIGTGIFVAPMFPEITDPVAIVDATKDFVDQYMFEDLQLRGTYRTNILKFIAGKYPHIYEIYEEIYVAKDLSYWDMVIEEAREACEQNGKFFVDALHHHTRDYAGFDPFGGDSLFK